MHLMGRPVMHRNVHDKRPKSADAPFSAARNLGQVDMWIHLKFIPWWMNERERSIGSISSKHSKSNHTVIPYSRSEIDWYSWHYCCEFHHNARRTRHAQNCHFVRRMRIKRDWGCGSRDRKLRCFKARSSVRSSVRLKRALFLMLLIDFPTHF